ncbi:hypothetical protein BFS05_01705 [Gardnerella vaginalis]|uniref:Uncharacterized protein n=1 Tax=Gardnerella vaginalis TaxID=2702 RepID=A0A2K1SWQ7_GARVA|nr:hypothetical protein BFS05_01705 [Gardnerella vaginalis]
MKVHWTFNPKQARRSELPSHAISQCLGRSSRNHNDLEKPAITSSILMQNSIQAISTMHPNLVTHC